MIIGSGFIAGSFEGLFAGTNGCLVNAAGVSNSSPSAERAFRRERASEVLDWADARGCERDRAHDSAMAADGSESRRRCVRLITIGFNRSPIPENE